jgi:hypothetical protein
MGEDHSTRTPMGEGDVANRTLPAGVLNGLIPLKTRVKRWELNMLDGLTPMGTNFRSLAAKAKSYFLCDTLSEFALVREKCRDAGSCAERLQALDRRSR